MIPTSNFKGDILVTESFPRQRFDAGKDLMIIDRAVAELQPGIVAGWKHVYSVTGGEALKDLSQFASHVDEILSVWDRPLSRRSRVLAVGGGSVGDFAGFFASVLKRGVVFEQCPSTWLAAIDSAHGGKTGLNVHGVKNQVGTFYPARAVHLVRSVLATQPEARALEGLGELIKIALVSGGELYGALARTSTAESGDVLWALLVPAIEAKYRIVLQDPYEMGSIRKVLNLGHTMGHVLESFYSRPHGECVTQGLWFALEWSVHKKILNREAWAAVQAVFKKFDLQRWPSAPDFQPLGARPALELLRQDKKATENDTIEFVFLEGVGKPLVEAVSSEDILLEAIRQGWVNG